MNENAHELWLQSAQNLQQSMTESLSKAFASFQNMDLGEAGAKLLAPTAEAPKIKFSAEKLQALQRQFLADAAELWTNSAQGKNQLNDRRFADAAWAAIHRPRSRRHPTCSTPKHSPRWRMQ